jgi:hypothetical protein
VAPAASLEAHAVHALLIAEDFRHLVIPQEATLPAFSRSEQPVLQDLFGAQPIAPVHQRDVRAMFDR